ncbi:MAG: DinB family protein, partial [Gemmatimonadaceae bacterium]
MAPTVTTGERLAAELRRAWNGAPWHGPSVRDVFGRLTAIQAATRNFHGSHTPRQLALHLTTWVDTPLRRLDDPAYDPTESQNFPEPASSDEPQWRRDLEQLGAVIERLAQRVAAMPDAALEAPVGARGYTYATMIDGVVQHLAYHAGQAAVLARPREELAPLLAPAPFFPLGAIVLAEIIDRFAFDTYFVPPRFLGWSLIVIGAVLAYWANGHFVAGGAP